MNKRQSHLLNTLQRVQFFLDQHASLLDGVSSSGARASLDQLVDTLRTHAIDQVASRRTGSAETVRQRVLRNQLLINHLRAVARVAEAQLGDVPDFVALSMPPYNTPSRDLVAAARAMAAAVTPYEDVFVGAGLRPDFLTRMVAAADLLEECVGGRGTIAAQGHGATEGMKDEFSQARKIVKVLNSLVVPKLQDNQALLAEWRASRRYFGQTGRTVVFLPLAPVSASVTVPPSMPAPGATRL
jgi:hypothetical protein